MKLPPPTSLELASQMHEAANRAFDREKIKATELDIGFGVTVMVRDVIYLLCARIHDLLSEYGYTMKQLDQTLQVGVATLNKLVIPKLCNRSTDVTIDLCLVTLVVILNTAGLPNNVWETRVVAREFTWSPEFIIYI